MPDVPETPLLTSSRHTGIVAIATLWMRGLVLVAGTILAGILSIVVGFNSPAATSPLGDYVHGHPVTALAGGGLLLAVTLVCMSIVGVPLGGPSGRRGDSPSPSPGGSNPRLLASLAVSTVSTLLFVSLLATVLLRPAWCPSAICPAPIVLTNPAGAHDANLEVAFTAFQSAYYAIPGDPAQYAVSNLPRSVGALYVGPASPSTAPYRVVLEVHSLQRGPYGLEIDQVAIVVKNVPPLAYPLNVWQAGEPLNYDSNVYQVTYSGEPAGRLIPAAYLTAPQGMTQLAPGEADEIDLQMISGVAAAVQFQVAITYRVTNESAEQTLTLPRVFEVDFSTSANWHVYHLQNGHFVASS